MSFKDLNINRRIRASFVRVIGKDGEQLGIIDTRKAMQLAVDLGLDLVEVAGRADPPVCKIMDYGKFKYQEKKKAAAARKKQSVVELKEIQIRPKTEDHDLSHKAKKALDFLKDGNKIKIIVVFRGREMEHIETGFDTLKEFCVKLEDQAVLEHPPRMEGRRMTCYFAPLAQGKKLSVGALVASFPSKPPTKPPRPQFGGRGGKGGGRGGRGGGGGFRGRPAPAAAAPKDGAAAAAPGTSTDGAKK